MHLLAASTSLLLTGAQPAAIDQLCDALQQRLDQDDKGDGTWMHARGEVTGSQWLPVLCRIVVHGAGVDAALFVEAHNEDAKSDAWRFMLEPDNTTARIVADDDGASVLAVETGTSLLRLRNSASTLSRWHARIGLLLHRHKSLSGVGSASQLAPDTRPRYGVLSDALRHTLPGPATVRAL